MSKAKSPYVGPRPFMKGDENIFYGRDSEAQALMSLIVSHSAVLLYSQSGAGKTSLLNTKVRQLLEAREVDVLGSSRVGGSLPPGVNQAEIANIFVYFALTSLEGEETSKKSCDGKTKLPEYLKQLPQRKRSDGALVQRVIFFDQFEEIFTTSQQRWEDRQEFFEQIGEALETDRLLRVVFAMREEYLASLNAYVSHLPERLRTRFHLERLRYESALAAVTRPLESTNRKFADGVAEQLVKNLLRVPVRSETGFQEITGEFVEPVQLQVVCQNIWDSLNDDVNEINAAFIESSGDVDVALTNYYDNCLKQLIETHPIKEARVRRWFDNELITVDGLRGTVYQGDRTTGSLPNEVVRTLEKLRLVRAEPRGGALWYELTHDRFIGPIRKSNKAWFDAQQGGLVSVLETKALEYRKDPRDESLLTGIELKNASDWLATTETDGSEVSDSLRRYILDSKNASAKRRARNLGRQVAGLVFLLVAALGLLAWALFEKGRADQARYVERAEVARNMIELKKYHDALMYGLKSVERALTKGAEPPPKAIENLRNALKAVGGGVWSQTISSASLVAVSPNGEVIFTGDSKEWNLWKGADGTKFFTQPVKKEPDNPTGGQKATEGSAEQSYRIESVFFSPAGKFLVIERRVLQRWLVVPATHPRLSIFQCEVWDLRNSPRQIINESGQQSLQFANDDSRLLIADNEKVRVIEPDSDKTIFSQEKKSQLSSLSPTGQQLIQVMNGAVVFRKFGQAEPISNPNAFQGSHPLFATFSDDGTKVVIFQDKDNKESVLTFWDAESGKKLGETTINSASLTYSFKVLAGNTSVLMATEDPFEESVTVQIWDVTNNRIARIDEKASRVNVDDRVWHLFHKDSTSITVLAAPQNRSSWVEFTGLPEKFLQFMPSEQLNAAVTLTEDNVMQYWKAGNFSSEIDKLPPVELYRRACDKLRYHEREFKEVSKLCEQPHSK